MLLRYRWAALVVALCLIAPAPPLRSQSPGAAAPTLHDLQNIAELRSAFDTDRGAVRIVLLLSPT